MDTSEPNRPVSVASWQGRQSHEPVKVKRSLSKSLAKFKRQSWMPSSQVTSTSMTQALVKHRNTVTSGCITSSAKRRPVIDPVLNGMVPIDKGSRHRSTLAHESQSLDRAHEKGQMDTLCSSRRTSDSTKSASPFSSSAEDVRVKSHYTAKTDSLVRSFRDLDKDYKRYDSFSLRLEVKLTTSRFQLKPCRSKTLVIRANLLPFLRKYVNDLTIADLRPEDLERRVEILDKWWTGLLEMLNGRHGESVSGNDRPTILEATEAIMKRPEWTTLASRFCKTARSTLWSRSTASLHSEMSDFVADSVNHNVRNKFSRNLLAQMAYVVDKMSAHTVPASVVGFCSVATAYAFFYCEGVSGFSVPRRQNLRD